MQKISIRAWILKGRVLGAVLVVFTGCLITTAVFLKMHGDTEKALKNSFAGDASIRAGLIIEEMNYLRVHLHTLAVFLERSDTLSRSDFREAVQSVMKNVPGYETLEWVPRIRSEELDRFMRAASLEGSGDFAIRERGPGGDLVPANRRSAYYPILYSEPFGKNTGEIGFDIGSVPDCLDALGKARDLNTIIAVSQNSFQREGKARYALIPVLEPVYAKGKGFQGLGEKRSAFRGCILGTISLENTVYSALRHTAPQSMPTELLDLSAPPGKRLMYELIPRISTSQGTQKFSFLYPEPTVLRQSFSFGGREFQVAITAGHLYLADHYSLVHWLVLPFGFALTILLALYLQALLSRQAKAEALVEKRTAELSISEQKYRGLFEQNKDGLVVCDLHGMIMDANRSTLRMIGYSSLDEIRGRPYSDFVPEKWHALDAELITNELAKKGYSEFYERECIHRDGTIFPVNCRTWLIREAGTRKVTSATIWFQDISERRKAEVILSETASRLNEAQYLAHIGSWELNLENHEIQWSPELFRILERDPSVSSPSFGTFIVLVHPLDREKVKQAFSFTGIGEQPQNIEYRLLMPDGRIKYIQQFFRMFFDGSGKPHHTAGTIQDVSERKKLEIEARLNQLRTDSLIRITQTSFPKIADLLDYALDEAIRLTESKIGYIYYYDDAKQEFILNTWSKDVMQECTVNDRENLTRYDLAKTGIWGEAVRQAKPIVINNFAASHPLKKGYPEGHVPLHRFLTIPVFSNSRIVAVVGVANKDTDYSDEDVHQLTLLMGSVWQIRERRRAEEVVKEYEQRYRSMFENNRAVMFMVNPETGRIIDANNAACSFYGYEKQEFVSLNISDISIMTKDEISERMQQAKSLQKESFVFRHRQKDGEVRDVEVFSGPISVGEQTVLYSIVHDITERRHAEKALRESEERFRDQFNGFPIPTYIWKRQSHDFQLVDYNNAALDFTRGKITEFKGIPASLFYEGRQWIIDDMNKCINEQAYIKNEFWDSLRTTGEKKFLAVRYTCLPPDLVMMHMEDITLQKEAQEHLVYMSIHDPMTGLYNRFYADSEIKRLKTSRKYPLSIIMVDIDGLKTVNDTGGHAAGDMLINNTAYILRQTFRPEDMVARIGGDEFLILLPSMDTATLDQTIRRLKVYLENFNASAPEVPVSFSIGAATVSSGDGIEESIKQADSLMYRDKALKKRPMDQ